MTLGVRDHLDSHLDPRVDSQAPPAAPRRPPVRRSRSTALVLLPLQLFLIAGWARAAAEKVIDPRWWTSASLRAFLAEQRPHMLPWFGWLSDHVLEPLAPQVAITVLGAQIGIAVCLATNHRVRQALWVGVTLNVCFTLAGRVNPSAFYLVMQLTMLVALSRPVRRQVALRRAGVWLSIAAVMAPFITTLHPRDVIEDPAMMLAFVAVLAAVATVAVSVPLADMVEWAERSGPGRAAVAWLRRRFDLEAMESDPALKQAVESADARVNGARDHQTG